jgi:GTP-binding protein Era
MNAEFHSGFAAIIGVPNVGKSTLLNRMLGQKISITSKKPQTTRNRILGIVHQPSCQIVFIDTPGIHKAHKMLNVRIVDVALAALGDADLILMVSDVSESDPDSDRFLIGKLKLQNKPVVLALNKTDLIKKALLLNQIEQWRRAFPFEAVIPVSAKNGSQVDVLINAMASILPEGPPYFPEDSLTDLPQRFIAAEMVREKAIRLTGQEIPYSVAVTIESFKAPVKGRLRRIDATIHVERDSHKGIIIGKKGGKLKQIGSSARKDIEQMLGERIFLKLFVHVQKNWSRDTRALRRFGY